MGKTVCAIILILYGVVMLMMCYIDIFKTGKELKNRVHFYVAREKNGKLWLYLGKPERRSSFFFSLCGDCSYSIAGESHFKDFGLNPDDFNYLKWEDEPIEVFVNMED